jgi:hypothetical protein
MKKKSASKTSKLGKLLICCFFFQVLLIYIYTTKNEDLHAALPCRLSKLGVTESLAICAEGLSSDTIVYSFVVTPNLIFARVLLEKTKVERVFLFDSKFKASDFGWLLIPGMEYISMSLGPERLPTNELQELTSLDRLMRHLGHIWIDVLYVSSRDIPYLRLGETDIIPASQLILNLSPPFYSLENDKLLSDLEVLGFFPVFSEDGQTPQVVMQRLMERSLLSRANRYFYPLEPAHVIIHQPPDHQL